MRLLIYNSKPSNNNFHLVLGLWRAFTLTPNVDTQITNSDSIGLYLKDFRPHVVLVFGGEGLTGQQIESIKLPEVKWLLWTTEDPFEIERNRKIAHQFEFVFTSDRASVALYDHPRCYYLPLAGDQQLFFRTVIKDPQQIKYDLLFIGTAWPNRSEFLAELMKQVWQKELKARFVLPTNSHIPVETWQRLPMRQFERDFRMSPGDTATLMNSSLCVLSVFRDFSSDGLVRHQSSPTNRFYETALTGTSQIIVSDQINFFAFYPTIEGSINQCRTSQEVIAAILRLKSDLRLRERQAINTQDFVLNEHLYEHRAKQIMDIISAGDVHDDGHV